MSVKEEVENRKKAKAEKPAEKVEPKAEPKPEAELPEGMPEKAEEPKEPVEPAAETEEKPDKKPLPAHRMREIYANRAEKRAEKTGMKMGEESAINKLADLLGERLPKPPVEPTVIPDPALDVEGYNTYVQDQVSEGIKRGLEDAVRPMQDQHNEMLQDHKLSSWRTTRAVMEKDEDFRDVLDFNNTIFADSILRENPLMSESDLRLSLDYFQSQLHQRAVDLQADTRGFFKLWAEGRGYKPGVVKGPDLEERKEMKERVTTLAGVPAGGDGRAKALDMDSWAALSPRQKVALGPIVTKEIRKRHNAKKA